MVYILISLPSTIALIPTKPSLPFALFSCFVDRRPKEIPCIPVFNREVLFEVHLVLLKKVISFCSFPCEVPRCSGSESYYHRPWFLILAAVSAGSSNSMSNVHIVCHEVTIFLNNHCFADFRYSSLEIILCTFGQPLQLKIPSPTVPILIIYSVPLNQRCASGLLSFCFSDLCSPSECRKFQNAPLLALLSID